LPDILAAIDALTGRRGYCGQLVRVEPLPSRKASYAEPDPPLPAPLSVYLEKAGIHQLYTHQVELLAAARRGENAIITTGTASGKTLGFNLPVFEKLLADPKATALYLYPMKAVTQDQLRVLKELEQAAGARVNPAVYDGDTSPDKRPGVRSRSRLVLSNPYELHQILPYHYQWTRFYQNLRYVVVDEAHHYRGVFGSNVAQLFRRLLRICRYYHSDPQFILASASIANPGELAGNLVGKEFTHVGNDAAPRGRGWLLFWNPVADPQSSFHAQVRELVAHFTGAGFQTLCFVQSRRTAELISHWMKQNAPALAVSPYRAGYVPEDRRRIEAELSSGARRGVVSTDALELGIDVGGLDCVIIAGYPGSLASFWQQAGRAGRKLQDSVAVFIGYADALNQYLLRHPEVVMARNFESAVVDLANPYILSGHLACAASELPLREPEVPAEHAPILKGLEDKLVLRRTPVGWIFAGTKRPQEEVTLDAIKEHAVEVVCDGRVLETLDLTRAYREAYPGAVLFHQGETYLVRSLDLKARRAEVEKRAVDFHTQVIQHEDLKLIETLKERKLGDAATLKLGRLRVTERFTGFRVKRFDQLISTHPLELPAVEFPTVGAWIEFAPGLAAEVESAGLGFFGGMHGAEHALLSIAPLVAMCDPRDIGGVSYLVFPETRLATIFVYDGYEDGIGISEKLYAEFDRLARVTGDLVAECGCDDGCPACILSPRCGDANEVMDKRAAVAILRRLAAPAVLDN
jgi:DEAD/DEAH box helicase domain-containing protein